MSSIRAIRTGLVKVKIAQRESRGKGVARMAHVLFDEDWTEWLPIHAWIIEHEEGVLLVDTGETSRVHEHGYHPSWHPFYRRAVEFSVHPDEEIAYQMRGFGINARDVRQVVLTHLHTDHAGGLAHLTGSQIWVSRGEFKRASGFSGKVQGYLPHRWPKWFDPDFIHFENGPLGPFQQSMSLTKRGDVIVVPTPGHTPDHVSVVVRGSPSFFLAGDTSYDQALLLGGKVDGVSSNMAIANQTLAQIVALARESPLVYLPSHDPQSVERLEQKSALDLG